MPSGNFTEGIPGSDVTKWRRRFASKPPYRVENAYATVRGCRSPLETALQILLAANNGQDIDRT